MVESAQGTSSPSCHLEGTGGASLGCPCKAWTLLVKNTWIAPEQKGSFKSSKTRNPLLIETTKFLNSILFSAFPIFIQMKKPIPTLLIGLLLSSYSGHSNKSVPSVKTSAKVVAVSPFFLAAQ